MMNAIQKKRLIAVLCIAAVAALLIFWRLRQAPVAEASTVKSDDGVVTLTVPRDALPDGVGPESLRVASLAADPDYPKTDDEVPAMYQLLPDGLQFKKPVQISLRFDDGGQGLIPFVLHISGKDETYVAEPLALSASFDQEHKKVTVTGEISHFSEIDAWSSTALWTVTTKTGGIFHHKVGESFAVSLKVKPTGKKLRHTYREGLMNSWHEVTYSVATDASWSFNGGFITRHGKLDPPRADFDRSGLSIEQEAEVIQNFKCAKEGWDKVEARDVHGAMVKYRLVKEYGTYKNSQGVPTTPKPDNDLGILMVDILEDHECQAPPPTTTTPPPTTADQPSVVNVAVGTLDATGGSVSLGGKKYYKVTSTDKARDTGNEVCVAEGMSCVGYTDLTLGSCLAFHPGALTNKDLNGSKAGFYCNGAPQGGICAKEANTCHICPNCNLNMECDTQIGDFYRETFVECR